LLEEENFVTDVIPFSPLGSRKTIYTFSESLDYFMMAVAQINLFFSELKSTSMVTLVNHFYSYLFLFEL